ncbi:MAG: DUF4174 domain-containing protein [Pseudomonadota bacterium]
MNRAPIFPLLLAAWPALAGPLDAHRWEHRPILVFSAADDPRLASQQALFEADRQALDDRRNVVIIETDPSSALAKHYRPDAFTVILVGLDGGEKFRANRVVEPSELNGLIDRMPMRRQELNRRSRDPNMGGG